MRRAIAPSSITSVVVLFGSLLLCELIASVLELGDDLEPFFGQLAVAVVAGVLAGVVLVVLHRFSKPDEAREGDRSDTTAEPRAAPRQSIDS